MKTTEDTEKTVQMEVTKVGDKVLDFCAVVISHVPSKDDDSEEDAVGLFTVSLFGGLPDKEEYDEEKPPVSEVLARAAISELLKKLEAKPEGNE